MSQVATSSEEPVMGVRLVNMPIGPAIHAIRPGGSRRRQAMAQRGRHAINTPAQNAQVLAQVVAILAYQARMDAAKLAISAQSAGQGQHTDEKQRTGEGQNGGQDQASGLNDMENNRST